MSQKEKLVKRFLERPESLRYAEIAAVLLSVGFDCVQAKGSHHKFKHPAIPYDLTVSVHGNECKNVYKHKALKLITTYRL